MSDNQLPEPCAVLNTYDGDVAYYTADQMRAYASEAVRAALAAQGEPVGEVFTMEALGTPGKPFCHVLLNRTLPTGTKLYTAPPAPAKPMTDERLAEVLTTAYGSPEWTMDDVRAARAVEEAHNITDKGGA